MQFLVIFIPIPAVVPINTSFPLFCKQEDVLVPPRSASWAPVCIIALSRCEGKKYPAEFGNH